MRKKRMFESLGSIAYYLLLLLCGIALIAVLYYGLITAKGGRYIFGLMILFYIVATSFMFVSLFIRGLIRYELTDEYLAEKTFWGKTQRKVYLNEIAQTGVSGVQDVHQIPKYIYLSKRILTEDEKRNLLIAGADGSIEFFRYRKKLEKYLKLMTNL